MRLMPVRINPGKFANELAEVSQSGIAFLLSFVVTLLKCAASNCRSGSSWSVRITMIS
jgi:hypothetical protein